MLIFPPHTLMPSSNKLPHNSSVNPIHHLFRICFRLSFQFPYCYLSFQAFHSIHTLWVHSALSYKHSTTSAITSGGNLCLCSLYSPVLLFCQGYASMVASPPLLNLCWNSKENLHVLKKFTMLLLVLGLYCNFWFTCFSLQGISEVLRVRAICYACPSLYQLLDGSIIGQKNIFYKNELILWKLFVAYDFLL